MPALDKTNGEESGSATSIRQLELELAIVLEEAREDLYAADVVGIFEGMRAGLSELPDWEQLRLAGTALLQLAEVCELRADRLCRDWEEGHNQTGPVLNDEVLEGLVQKTTHIDISALIADPLPRGRKQPGKRQPTDSIIGEVDKTTLLQVLDAIADEAIEKERALQVAHDENVSVWVETIAQWMHAQPVQAISLLELQRSLPMPLIEIWLALLLGGYGLEQRGAFYGGEIWVTSNKFNV